MSFSRAVASTNLIGRGVRSLLEKRFTSLSAVAVFALAASCSGDDAGSDLKCGTGTKEVGGKCVLDDSGAGGASGADSAAGGVAGKAGSSGAGGAATGGVGGEPDASTGGSAGQTLDSSAGGSAGNPVEASTGGTAGATPDAGTGGNAGATSDASSGGNAGAATGGAAGADASTGGSGGLDSGAPDAGGCPPWFTDAGTSVGAPSCASGASGAGTDCGYQGLDDCCASIATPCGTFNRGNNVLYPATVSSFRLDKYEVTVGRFRKFVEAGGGVSTNPPPAGSGAHPNIPGTAWDSSWNASLSAQPSDLITKLKCDFHATWTDAAGAGETRPINCVDWYTAFAFCVWDGGRLPTEAEWNYTAAGGKQQYYYAFKQGIGANINPNVVTCSANLVQPVGKPQWGFGYWNQWDQSGNVEEWTFDRTGQYSVPCVDCATLVNGTFPGRAVRGGHYQSCVGATPETNINTIKRVNRLETSRMPGLGFRCARQM